MVNTDMILNLFGHVGKMSANQISDLASERSPLPIPKEVVEKILNQLVSEGKLSTITEDGTTYYKLP